MQLQGCHELYPHKPMTTSRAVATLSALTLASGIHIYHCLCWFSKSSRSSLLPLLCARWQSRNAVASLSPQRTDIRVFWVSDSSLMISFGFAILRCLLVSNYGPTQHESVFQWEQNRLFVCVFVGVCQKSHFRLI